MKIRFIAVLLLTLAQTAVAAPYAPIENYKRSFSYLGDKESLTVLASGLAVVATTRVLDEEARDYFAHKQRLGQIEELGNEVLGTGVPGILIGATFWVTGATNGDLKAEHAGQAQLESIVATSLVTSAGKWSVRRSRPDRSDQYSFPSGHTSTMFASASVLSRFYGWRAGFPAYSLAIATGLARMADDRHWFSDTAGGALIGELIGQAIARSHLNDVSQAVTFLPLAPDELDPHRQGLVARWAY